MKQGDLRRLCTVLFQVYDILERQTEETVERSVFPGASGERRINRWNVEGLKGSEAVLYDTI